MRNPFITREIEVEEPFCDRITELKELTSYALSFANVVLYSPRRYGKTSLMKRVQKTVQDKGIVTVYVDFFGLASVDEVAHRLIEHLYRYCHKEQSLFKKAMQSITLWRPVLKPDPNSGFEITVEQTTQQRGLELLKETFTLFSSFVKEHANGFHIVLDEFQEITNLKDSIKIEGVLRSQIQTQTNVGYVFVGSRRRMLLDIFNEQKKPFYKSAINYPLDPLPKKEATDFIARRFRVGGKECSVEIAERVYDRVGGYPYYIQRLPFDIWEQSDKKMVTDKDYENALLSMIKIDTPYYESILSGLSNIQKQLFYALAKEPFPNPLNPKFMMRHKFTSPGSTQAAHKKLLSLDLVEKKEDDGNYHVVDPILESYLKKVM